MGKEAKQDAGNGMFFFHDNYVPALVAGNWRIQLEQIVEKDNVPLNIDKDKNKIPLIAEQEFLISAPQFSLPPAAVAAKFPPEESSGLYKDVLPHILLSDPVLPWERKMKDAGCPWLALLVLTEDELTGAEKSPTRSSITTVAEFMKTEPGVLKGSITKEEDIADDDPCSSIKLTVNVFKELIPQNEELNFLAHCRKVNMEDKAENSSGDGFFSVVIANRFPAAPAENETKPKKNIVHLVSIEGLTAYLSDKADFGNYTHVSLLSLASWTFSTLPASHEDFKGLVNKLVKSGAAAEDQLLRIPVPKDKKGDAETLKRIGDGFIPMLYHTRTGEETPAWYRGPFTPVIPATLKKKDHFLSADAALIYDKNNGVFDLSLSSAWTIGRALALADKNFAQLLYELRRKTHRTTDLILHRQTSNYFTPEDTGEINPERTAQEELGSLFDHEFISGIATYVPVKQAKVKATPSSKQKEPVETIEALLENKKLQRKLISLVDKELDPVSKWLARLALLYPVPFNYLVPNEKLLPEESLRFFYVDNNWIEALLDGALSIGLESSRETKLHSLHGGIIKQAAMKSAAKYRAALFGKKAPKNSGTSGPVCGLLLRSALVSGWPALAIRPYKKDAEDRLLTPLRFERLSANVILCLFDGVPDYIEIAEPYESMRFGTEETGTIPLRNLIAPTKEGDPETGEQLKGDPVLKVRDVNGKEACCMRNALSRTLNLSPSDKKSLQAQIKSVNPTAKELGPAFLALQMIKSPEAIHFITQNKTNS